MKNPKLVEEWFFVTSFCNFAHRLSDGKPIKHECWILNPAALQAEREGDYEKAREILTGKRIHHRGVK